MTFVKNDSLQRLVYGTCFVLLAITAAQSLGRGSATPAKTPPQNCKGEPIIVGYPFQGGFLDPHACKIQCNDGRQRFVYYTNGKATQCETPPGCNDWGEDRSITCTPPDSLLQSQSLLEE